MTAAARVMTRCAELAQISEEEGRLTRRFATPAMRAANDRVGGWMRSAGLEVWTDAAGNLIGRRRGTDPAAGTLLLGSHLDTVRDAGAYDGPLGILVALAALEEHGPLPFTVDVLAFSDEEGLRYGTAYLGSHAVAGSFPPELLALQDEEGVRLDDALRAFGGDPERLADAARTGERLLGYCEVHIEQGPVLEERRQPVAVVRAIAGATRAHARFTGRAGHAGTSPMAGRRDAACAAAELVLVVEAAGRRTAGLLATVGELGVRPGAPNVIPGRALLTLDVRHADDAARAAAVAALRREAEAIALRRRVELEWSIVLDTPAVEVDPALTQLLEEAVTELDVPPVSLLSGAGHDGVVLARLTGIAMLFVRCARGLSHHPDESVEEADVAVALAVLQRFLTRLAE